MERGFQSERLKRKNSTWGDKISDLKTKTMADKLMYIQNKDMQKYPFCRLKLVVETFGDLINQICFEIVKSTNKKTLL